MLLLPSLLSIDPLLVWSMEVFINVGKYLLHNVPNAFPDSNALESSLFYGISGGM